jgi:hypothetical protein
MGLLDKAKDAAKVVGDKAQEGLKAGQEKVDEVKTKKQISELKEQIGGIVYLQRTGAASATAEADIDRMVGEVKDAEERLAG